MNRREFIKSVLATIAVFGGGFGKREPECAKILIHRRPPLIDNFGVSVSVPEAKTHYDYPQLTRDEWPYDGGGTVPLEGIMQSDYIVKYDPGAWDYVGEDILEG